MAGWLATIQYPDGFRQYGCWQTSTDSMWAGLMDEQPPREQPVPRFWKSCTCGREPEDVRVYCDDDEGHWAGKACRHCCSLIEGRRGWPEYGGKPMQDFVSGPLPEVST